MLERQIMFKQLQELQRQKKLEELNDARQQNVMDQLSLMHYKQSSGTQSALLNNGIPVRDASQMFTFGNTNLLQGLSNRLAQNQLDGTAMSNESASLLTKHKSKVNDHDRYAPSDESGWPDRFYGKMENVGRNQDLDPLEQKILFNMKDNMGTESFENTDHSSDFHSLQSGSMSALMQSAVAEASSGDAGLQKEWSGSGFQNPELSNENQPSNIEESEKHPTPWLSNKLPNPKIMRSDANHRAPKEAGQGFLPDIPRNFIDNDKSAGFPAPNSTGQARAPKAEPDDAFTPPHNNSSRSQCFGLKLTPPSQRQLVNYFDPSRTSLQAGHSSKPFQDPQSNNNQLRNQETSHLVSVKNEDGQQSLTLEAKQRPMAAEMAQKNMRVDVPVQQNPSGMVSCETASEASKKYVKSENNLFETDAHMNNSQGNLEAFGRSLKQADASSHNHSHVSPMNYDLSRRAMIKTERVTCDDKIPQATSLAQPKSAYGNYTNHLGSSAAKGDQLVKSSSQPPLPSVYSKHLDVANQNMAVLKSKKRKCPTFERLPWHREVTEECLGLHDMSTAEMEWAQSANRLPEQLKVEAEKVAHSRGVVHQKRRLIFTTQLMQLLFRPAPAMALLEDATAHCDTVTYYSAKLALGDACSLAGHFRNISGSSSRTSMISKSFDHYNLSKTVEGLIDRSKRLEDELLRLEKGESSILEVRVEFQDLDKLSVINRFAKFHGRGPLATADTASSGGGGSTVPKLYPQRYVTASPMPKMVPEGRRCLSL